MSDEIHEILKIPDLPVIEIVDELMFTEGCEYLKFIKAKDKTDWFINNHDTCFDWYYMEQAEKLIHRNLK